MITIPVAEFRRLVTLAAPFAGKDRVLPGLMTIRFDTRDGHLLAAATDRYHVIVAKTECDGDFHALLPVEACKRIAATFKPDRRTRPDISLTAEDGQVCVSLTGTVSGIENADLTVPQFDGQWPDVAKVVRRALDAEPAKAGLNTALLRDVPNDGERAVIIPAGDGNPALIVARDWIVCQMAMRGAEDPADAWRGLLAGEEREATAA